MSCLHHLAIYRLLVFGCLTSAATAAGNVTAAGVVLDTSGRPAANVVVLARKIPVGSSSSRSPFQFARLPGDIDHSVTALTGANGGFSLSGLLPARYSICAELEGSFLNTCIWSGDYVRDMSVVSQQSGIALVVKSAALVRIDVLDPTKLVGAFDPLFGAPIVVGVKAGMNGFYAAKLVSHDSAGLHYQIAVPLNQALAVWLFSRFLGISDASGNALDHLGVELPFQANAGAVPAFTFTLTGLN